VHVAAGHAEGGVVLPRRSDMVRVPFFLVRGSVRRGLIGRRLASNRPGPGAWPRSCRPRRPVSQRGGAGRTRLPAAPPGIQAVQAFDQLNDQTPLKNVGLGLIVAALRSFFTVVVPATNVETMAPTLKRLGLGTDAMEQLTDQQLVAEPGTQD